MSSEKQYKSLIILGRQPEICLAELEAVLGAESIKPFGSHCLSTYESQKVPSMRLGGLIKNSRVLLEMQSCDWSTIESHLLSSIPERAKKLPPGKLTLGISVYGINVKVSTINQTTLKLKKIIKNSRSIRVVPNKELSLNTAQVVHNKLVEAGNWEILVVSDGNKTYLAQTTFVQDIESYAARDRLRPKRDTLVGMLPPKLAQIIVNLATGNSAAAPEKDKDGVLLDPFCGTGVLVQEALLSGLRVVGSDIDERMISYSNTNIAWLKQNYGYGGILRGLYSADATNYKWAENIRHVASEIYLGPVLKGRINEQNIHAAKNEVNEILASFLANLAPQIKQGTKLCLAVPCWEIKEQFEHLPIIDQLAKLGYNRVSFTTVKTQELIYYRPGQAVARELLVLTKN